MDQKLSNLIIVPTDFSETCQNAINHGSEIAAYLDYKLVILHVFDKESKSILKKEDLSFTDLETQLSALAKKASETYNIHTDFLIKEGNIFDEIHKAAGDLGANLMVLGTHGKKGLQFVFGSHALKVVTKSPVPTVVVQKRGFGEGYKKIVFPINDFTEARQQVQWAVHMAQRFGSKIYIFQQPSVESDLALKIKIVTQQIEDAFNEMDINFEIVTAEKPGNFAKQLISFAASKHADMIMIMTDADVFSPDFRSGQWDETMMFNEAQIPVMCINPVITGQVFYNELGSGF